MLQKVEAGRELGAQALRDLGKALPDLVGRGITAIEIDSSRVVEFDSQTLEALVEFEALAKSRSLAVVVVDPAPIFGEALRITGAWGRVQVDVRRDPAEQPEAEGPGGDAEAPITDVDIEVEALPVDDDASLDPTAGGAA